MSAMRIRLLEGDEIVGGTLGTPGAALYHDNAKRRGGDLHALYIASLIPLGQRGARAIGGRTVLG
jgi:hypothetical protein